MEFLLQLLAQLFSSPAEDKNKTERVEAPVTNNVQVTKETEIIQEEEQLEPNFFNVMDFR